MKKSNRKKNRGFFIGIGIILGIVVLLIVFFAFSRTTRQWQWVEVATVESTNLTREITANGEIGSRESEMLTSRINGIIKTLFVEIGDKVNKDTLVALIDDEKLKIQQQSALSAIENTKRSIREQLLTLRTSYTQAKTGYEQAKRNYENISQSHARGAASDEQLTQSGDALALAEQTFESARQKLNFREGRSVEDLRTKQFKTDDDIINTASEVKEAVAGLDSINKNLADCEIRTGINGVITDIRVETGSVVVSGNLVCTVHNPSLLEVIANIDEVDISYIKLNQEVKIESDAFIGSILKGTVSDIAPVIKRIGESRVCAIKINFSDSEKKAKIGASCSIFVIAEKRENVPAIPIESYIVEKDKKYTLMVVKDESAGSNEFSKVIKTEIETGLMGIEKVEIVKGLNPGDEIIKNNLKNIKDGDKVKLKR